jgi:PKD domain
VVVGAVLAVSAAPAGAVIVTSKSLHRTFSVAPAIGSSLAKRAACTTDCTPLIWHSGPVQHTEQEYFLYWEPTGFTMPASYTGGLNTWLSNVQHDRWTPGNVFAVTQQYYDLSGPGGSQRFVPYGITNAGQIADTNPFPASGCNDGINPTCLTDSQVQAEITKVVSANHLRTGLETQFLLFLPANVGECFQNGGPCAYSTYCAYHSWNGTYLYAVEPWTYQTANCDANAFFGLGYANNSPIDPEVGVLSHEISETMTDPQLNSWYDAAGNEIGDKCAYNYDGQNYGTHSGLPNNGSGFYNQVINGGQYLMQTEFSNRDSNGVSTGCVPQDNDTQPTATVSIVPNSPVHGTSAKFTANVTTPVGVTVNRVWWSFGDGTYALGNPVNHTYATAGSKSLTMVATDSHGNEVKVTQTVTVS